MFALKVSVISGMGEQYLTGLADLKVHMCMEGRERGVWVGGEEAAGRGRRWKGSTSSGSVSMQEAAKRCKVEFPTSGDEKPKWVTIDCGLEPVPSSGSGESGGLTPEQVQHDLEEKGEGMWVGG